MKRTLLTAALCFAVGAAVAGNVDPLLRKYDVCGRFEVFHINGIMTNRTDATLNRERIKEVYGNAYKEHIIAYGLAYNQTRGFTTDVYQSALQVISGYTAASWDLWVDAVTFGVYSVFMPDATAKAIAQKVADLYAFTKPSPYQDQDLADLMFDFAQQSGLHARLVIVPHSQGNLYANLVYDKLIAGGKAAKSIGVVGVAVPFFSVRSGNTYITSANDVVIDAVRKVSLSTVLAPNVTVPRDPLIDKLGHNFRSTYLANTTVKGMLFSHITNEFNSLRTTSPDPPRWLITKNHGRVCFSAVYPAAGPWACYTDVPTGAPYQYHMNVSINFYSNPSIGPQQHEYGTAADLDPLNRHFMATCYTWYLSDRKAQIKKYNFILDSGYYWPSNIHPGSCGYGFPWQTPYGNPDAAWMIYSADSSKITSKTWAADAVWYYNDVEKRGVCKR